MTTEDIQVTPGIELRILSKILIIFQTEGNLQGKLHQMPYSHLKHVSVYCSWFIIKGIYERNKTSQSQHSVLHWSRQKYVWLSSLPPLMVKRKASQECGNTRFSRMRWSCININKLHQHIYYIPITKGTNAAQSKHHAYGHDISCLVMGWGSLKRSSTNFLYCPWCQLTRTGCTCLLCDVVDSQVSLLTSSSE